MTFAAADLGARRCHLGIGGPRVGVAVTTVHRVDVLKDHASGARHLLSDRRWECHPLTGKAAHQTEQAKRLHDGLRRIAAHR